MATAQDLSKWRIYCFSESDWQYTVAPSAITLCPNDSGHSANVNSVNAVETIQGVLIGATSCYDAGVHPAILADTSGHTVSVNLPQAFTVGADAVYYVKRQTGDNTVLINAFEGDNIAGASTSALGNSGHNFTLLKSDGATAWASDTVTGTRQLIPIRKSYRDDVRFLPRKKPQKILHFSNTSPDGIEWARPSAENTLEYMYTYSGPSDSTSSGTFVQVEDGMGDPIEIVVPKGTESGQFRVTLSVETKTTSSITTLPAFQITKDPGGLDNNIFNTIYASMGDTWIGEQRSEVHQLNFSPNATKNQRTLRLNFRRVGGAGTVNVRQIYMELSRVS
jgi:hypothetical protein